jgi:hypothetical protein
MKIEGGAAEESGVAAEGVWGGGCGRWRREGGQGARVAEGEGARGRKERRAAGAKGERARGRKERRAAGAKGERAGGRDVEGVRAINKKGPLWKQKAV